MRKTIFLKTFKDFNKLEPGCVAESGDGMLLRKAFGKARVNPLRAQAFWKDDGLARACAEAGGVFEIQFSAFLAARGRERARLMQRATAFLKKCVKRRACYALSNGFIEGARVRSDRELQSFGECLGLSLHQAKAAVEEGRG